MAANAFKTIFVYITTPSRDEARKIAKHLLNKKLIACANIHKIESLYRWKGKLVNSAEWVLFCKTLEPNFMKVKNEVDKIHSYEIPCIVKIPAVANEKYSAWVKRELKTGK